MNWNKGAIFPASLICVVCVQGLKIMMGLYLLRGEGYIISVLFGARFLVQWWHIPSSYRYIVAYVSKNKFRPFFENSTIMTIRKN